MPLKQQTDLPLSAGAPQHYAPPTTRELRAQAVHRLQIGFVGLAGVLLVVGLANIIMTRAQQGDAAAAGAAAGPMVASDPMVAAGVAPAASPAAEKRPAKSGR